MDIKELIQSILYNISNLIESLETFKNSYELKNLLENFRRKFIDIEEELRFEFKADPNQELNHEHDKDGIYDDDDNGSDLKSVNVKLEIAPVTIKISKPKHSEEEKSKRKYTCHVCGKEFRSSNSFQIHELKHFETSKDFVCNVCGKTYGSQLELRTHIRQTHNRPKNFLCAQCDYATDTRTKLERHMDCHTDEKPFSCHICNLKVKSDYQLKDHLSKVHPPERKYVCKICGKAFKKGNHLKTHVRIHTGEKEAHCDICGKDFVQKYNYTLHMRNKHGVDC